MSPAAADFKLRYALGVARRRLPIFLISVILVPAAAVAFTLAQKDQYTATASLLFRDPGFDQMLFGAPAAANQSDPTRAAATNLDLVSLPRVAALTAAALRTVTEAQVSAAVQVSNSGQSNLTSVQATADSPRLATELATTFANQYIAFRRGADRVTLDAAQVPLQRQIAALPNRQRFGALGQSLQQRLSQLRVLASLQTGNAELVQPAEVPRRPSSPNLLLNGALGLFFGVLIGTALVVLAEALDRRLRDPEEVEQMFERPLLASVPASAELASADADLIVSPGAQREAFRMLWVNLRYFSLSREVRSVLVTSSDRNDGKSTVAWGLGVAAASSGARTLLVEADLHNPTFAKRFGLPSREGLTSVLADAVTRVQAVTRVPLPLTESGSSTSRSMDVLVAGPRPPDPADLLQSRRMSDFLSEVEDEYEMVIIDSPPAAIVSDAIPLITMVRGVIVVSRLGNTVRDHLRRLRQQLDQLDTPTIGVVINSVERADPYGYGYGYGGADPAPSGTGHDLGGSGDNLSTVSVSAGAARPAGEAPLEGEPVGNRGSATPAQVQRRRFRNR